jgi:hypothetical protein
VSEHLTTENVRDYALRSAPSAAILAWDDHLAQCDQCRALVAPSAGLAQWAAGLSSDEDEDGHLTREQLAARAENRVPDGDRFAVESHLTKCPACREELADLVQFRHEVMQAAPARAVPIRRTGFRWSIAAAAAAAVVIGIALWRTKPGASPIDLPGAWSREDRLLVEQTVKAGTLPFTPPPADLASRTGTLLGTSSPNAFAPLAPLAKIVETDRPQFEWQELAGATNYKVEVYDTNFNLVSESPSLSGLKWTPSQPIARGELYHWQVTAVRKKEAITVPSPPAPQADFRVLDQPTEDRIEQARASGPMGHVLAATLLAKAGMESSAVEELNQLPEETRKLPAIAPLLIKRQ